MPEISPAVKELTDWKPDETSPLMELKRAYFKALPEVCVERPHLVTEYHKKYELLGKERISVLEKAKVYRDVLENREPVVRHVSARGQGMKPFVVADSSPFAGSTTSKFKGVVIHPELVGLMLWPELLTLPDRSSNPFYIEQSEGKSEVDLLNHEVFPPWLDYNILEVTRDRCFKDNFVEHGVKKSAPEIDLLQNLVFFLTSKPLCISHTIPDFSRAVYEGLDAVIADAEQRKVETPDPAKKEFYEAVTVVLQGIVKYAERLADKAEKHAAAEHDPVKKGELEEIARIYRKVPGNKAETFREGLTTVWLCWIACHLESPNVGLSLGRLDQLLYPLYKNDVAKGILDPVRATELICYLWLKIGDHVPIMTETAEQLFGGTGANQAITIGGVDKEGKDAVNDLTYIILRATEIMMMRDPNLNARYYEGKNSPDYLRRLCEANVNTRATPALHNDKAVIHALMDKGDSEEQARDYGIVGCVEPISAGRTYSHNAAILINLTAALELTLYNGRHRHTGVGPDGPIISRETGNPADFTTFAELKEAFAAQAKWLADKAVDLNNLLGRTHQRIYPTPILSSLFEGPMDKGMDVIQGGATINASGASIIGLADVADSLSAIEAIVFPKNGAPKKTISDILNAMADNFDGGTATRATHAMIVKSPKYGNDDPAADANVEWLVKLLDGSFSNRKNYRGGHHRVGYWTMTIHAGIGKLIGALPSGRKAGENLASGITPVSGVTPTLTKALNSVAGLPSEALSSGVALNLKFTPNDGPKEKLLDELVARVKAFVLEGARETDKTGGMEIQFNITDRKIFEGMARDPKAFIEAHPEVQDLLVRVSGYTAYFKDLSPQMQKEIIERTQYKLSTGAAETFLPYVPPTPPAPIFNPGDLIARLKKLAQAQPNPWLAGLTENLIQGLTDHFLHRLLQAMDISFHLSQSFVGRMPPLDSILGGYHRNIKGFKGRYLFETRNGAKEGVVFEHDRMKVLDNGIDDWNVKVTFKDDWALLGFLVKGSQGDVMDELLGHKVEAQGNLNYLMKFGFMARDLLMRFGLIERA